VIFEPRFLDVSLLVQYWFEVLRFSYLSDAEIDLMEFSGWIRESGSYAGDRWDNLVRSSVASFAFWESRARGGAFQKAEDSGHRLLYCYRSCRSF